jgi:hypothetical protein
VPSILTDAGGFSVATGCAAFLADMVSVSSASSAADVDDFAGVLAERGSAFAHGWSLWWG